MSVDSQATAIVLAAGKGTRMRSERPKVLFEIEGRPLIHHVLDAVETAGFRRVIAVVGFQHERVRAALAGRAVEFALQEEQLGTGHAVQMAAPLLTGGTGDVVVLAGDVPLIRPETLWSLLARHTEAGAAVTVLTAILPDASGYGRIVRASRGGVLAIVEHRDCTSEQLAIREINSSIYAFRVPFLLESLPLLRRENRQGEYYLTDTVAIAVRAGLPVEAVVGGDFQELAGVNTPEQLEAAAVTLRARRR